VDEFHRVFFLVHDDPVGVGESVDRRSECACNYEADYLPFGTYVSQGEHA